MQWMPSWAAKIKPAQRETIAETVEDYLQGRRDLSAASQVSYRNVLDCFQRFTGPDLPAEQLTEKTFRQFLARQYDRHLKPATIRQYHAVLKNYCQTLVNREIISANPMLTIETPRRGAQIPQALTREQTLQLVRACGRSYTGRRMRAMLCVFLECGLRVSELSALSLTDLDLNLRRMFVQGKGGKERIIEFGETLKIEMEEWFYIRAKFLDGRKCDALFPTQNLNSPHRAVIHRQIAGLAKSAGIDCSISPHTLRHTCLTFKARDRGDGRPMNLWKLRELAGHSSIKTTQIYVSACDDEEIGDTLKYIFS